jgi:ATP-dependent exoDNAse (exonuclease V) alpha subunit
VRAQVNLAARAALGYPELVMGPQVGERVIAYSTTRGDNPVANGEIGVVKVCRECNETVGGEHAWWVVVDFGGVEHKLLVPSASWEGKDAQKLGAPKAVTMPVSRAAAHAKPVDQMRLVALQPAYGITVHKAQGSEWPGGCIILDVPYWLGDDAWRHGYTAVTRLQDWVQFIRITGVKTVAINRPPADMSQVRMVGR